VQPQRPPAGTDAQQPGQVLIGGHVPDFKDSRLRVQAVLAHAFGVAGQLEQLRHLRLGDEGALALHAQQAALDHQFSQRLAHRGP
jgi:hypothetical protein